MAEIQVHGTIKNLSSAPDIGFQYQDNGQPWASIAGAHNGVPEPYRAIGKIRFIDRADGKGVIEYWYKGGIALENLVPRYENLESAESYVAVLEGLKADAGTILDQTALLRNETEQLKEDTISISVGENKYLGTYNAGTNIATNKETGATHVLTTIATEANGYWYEIDMPGSISITGSPTPIPVIVGGKIRSSGTKYDYIPPSDAALSIAKGVDEGMRLIEVISASSIAGAFNGGITDGTASTITVPIGYSGLNTFLRKIILLSDHLTWRIGASIHFRGILNENIAGISGTNKPNFALNVTRNGVTVFNVVPGGGVATRLSLTQLQYDIEYVIQTGDSAVVPVFQLLASTSNSSGSSWIWTWTKTTTWVKSTGTELPPIMDKLRTDEDKANASIIAINAALALKLSQSTLAPAIVTELNVSTNETMGVLGRVINSGSSGSFSASTAYQYNSNAIMPHDGMLYKLIVASAEIGTRSFAFGIPGSDGFRFRKQIGPYNLVVGLNEIILNESFLTGETLALNGGTANIYYNTSGGSGDERWVEATLTSVTSAGLGSYVCIELYFKYNTPNALDILASDRNFGSKSKTLADYGYKKTTVSLGFPLTHDGTVSLSTVGYIGNNTPFSGDGEVSVYNINILVAGSLKIVLGSIDQNKFFLPDITVTKSVVVGDNALTLNIKVSTGQVFMIDKSSTASISTLVSSNSYLNSVTYASALSVVSNRQISCNYLFTEIAPAPFATKEQYISLLSKCNSLEQLIDSMRPRQSLSKVVLLGNSLVWHPIETTSVFWYGEYGMAASERSKDLAHLLYAKMQIDSPSINLSVKAINDWEASVTNNTAYDYATKLNTTLGDGTKSMAVIVRLLDNVKSDLTIPANVTALQAKCVELLTYLKNYCVHPETVIIATGCWYASSVKDLAMKNACALVQGCQFLPISAGATPENKSSSTALHLGDDGIWRTSSNPGVWSHPGDLGHAWIADAIFPLVKYKKVV